MWVTQTLPQDAAYLVCDSLIRVRRVDLSKWSGDISDSRTGLTISRGWRKPLQIEVSLYDGYQILLVNLIT
ncbi:hypothetical protein HNP81_000461 [Peribacillus huizhouensis]|uniref:Uncharacterized protein n=1 Tax=Peribacillus huizhouensis TaxID=1501239 RepID=A0ABR6CJW2_9BACI|nr:hypothetical protein [Peribacillus huizhouensis]